MVQARLTNSDHRLPIVSVTSVASKMGLHPRPTEWPGRISTSVALQQGRALV